MQNQRHGIKLYDCLQCNSNIFICFIINDYMYYIICYNPDGDCGYGWYWCTIFTREWNVAKYEGQYLPGNSEKPETLGAFENAENLRKVIIPESVVQIGGKSFSGTLLKSVEIAENCRCSATSFPADCVINFYK